MKEIQGIMYSCPECGKWWIVQDNSEELEDGRIYCPYCDDYSCNEKKKVIEIQNIHFIDGFDEQLEIFGL